MLLLTTSLILELYLGSRVAELFEVPSSLQFVRDYVAKNVPVIIRNATLDWPAVSKWNSKYFRCVYDVGDDRLLFTYFMYITHRELGYF